ncbi:unnamed protein product, partial [Gordionus sp. m RMFG-2023]
ELWLRKGALKSCNHSIQNVNEIFVKKIMFMGITMKKIYVCQIKLSQNFSQDSRF